MQRTLPAAVLASVALALAPAAAAGDVHVSLGLGRGGVSAHASTPTRTASGFRTVVTVTDARGTGDGWTLRASDTEVLSVTATCAEGSTCTLPRFAGRGAALRALHDSGMGVVRLVVVTRAAGQLRLTGNS